MFVRGFSFILKNCLNRRRYAGQDSKENAEETMQKSELNKQETAVAKKTRTALEMKVTHRH